MKNAKSVEERQKICLDIKGKLVSLGLSPDFDTVRDFIKILDEYSKPNVTSGFSGVVSFPEIGRRIEYVLPIRSQSQPVVKMVAI